MGKYKKVVEIDYSDFDALSSEIFKEELEADSNLRKEMEAIVTKEQLLKLDEIASKRLELNKRLQPICYLGVTKDPRNGAESIVGKSNWVKDDGSRTSLQVYCGRLVDFLPLGLENPIAKKICIDKMRKKIQDLFPIS